MSKYKLGDRIKVMHRLKRQRTGHRYNWTVEMFSIPKEVIVVGVRTLWDGYLDQGNGNFVMTRSKKALLVAENLKSVFYVFV